MDSYSLIDFHCDTLYKMEKANLDLSDDSLAVSLAAIRPYRKYAQFFASWCSTRFTNDQGYDAFCRMADYLDAQLTIPEVAERLVKVRTATEMNAAFEQGKQAAFLAVEDARILNGDLSRLDELASRGVRYLTLCWGGETCIGGSFDTDIGLTDFGKRVVVRCFELGILPDLSHTNQFSAQDTIDLAIAAKKPLIASHSNAYGLYPHPRNLRDEHFVALRDNGGLVGLNFCHVHLCDETQERACVSHLVRHLEHYLSLGGENIVAIGGDWDGTKLPEGFETIADATKLAEELARLGYSDALIKKLFFDNAYEFICKHIN